MENKSIHCTLTDAELAAKADQWIDELIASGGKSFTMQVPARPNKDTDLIFAELNNRFKILVQENERLKAKLSTYHGIKERCDKMEAALKQFISYHETGLLPDIFTYRKGLEALKEGESNTLAPVQEIEYMPILSAELSELRKYANVPVRVPMHLLNDEQADRNHGQTLQRLKERGGVGVKEALSLITLKRWMHYKDIPMDKAIAMLNDIISNDNTASVQGENKIVVHDNSDAFRNWVTSVKGYEISLLGHFTGVSLPVGITSEILAKEWHEYETANNSKYKQ